MAPLSTQQEVGFEPLDAEHGEVAGVLRRLGETVAGGQVADVRAAMAEVVEKVAAHFAHEEQLMRDGAYPQLARHKQAHDLFLADVARFQQELAERGLTARFRQWASGPLLEWFTFHIVANDVRLGEFLRTRQRGPAKSPGRPVASGKLG